MSDRGVPVLLEAATLEDLPTLSSLERQSFSHPWSLRGFQEAHHDRQRTRIVVLRTPLPGLERGIAGYAVYRLVVDELEVHDLAIHPALRRRGLGLLLMDLVLGLAVEHGVVQALLEVRAGNWAALGLYRRLGFEVVGTRRDYYQQPREDALLLSRRLVP